MKYPTDEIIKMYNDAWENSLASGREEFGDIECNISFIKKPGLIEKHHSILEFGCGFGKLCNWLSMNGYQDVTGLDISEAAIQYGLKHFPNLKLICTDVDSFNTRLESFDVCLGFDFIEHLFDVPSHLRKACSLLKPGGKYLIQTPNIVTNTLYSTIIARGFRWLKSHPSLQSRRSLERSLLETGFSHVDFHTISPVSDYKLRELHPVFRSIFAHIPWEKIPSYLQIGFSAAAWK